VESAGEQAIRHRPMIGDLRRCQYPPRLARLRGIHENRCPDSNLQGFAQSASWRSVANAGATARPRAALRMVVSIGVNERDGGSLFNSQLLFDADGTLIQRRRKIPRRITSAWCGARAMAADFEPWTARWVASVSWPVGSTTTRWPDTR
jgi:hypothetical protein